MPQTKLELRKKYRAIRADVPKDKREQAAASAAKLLTEHPVFKQSKYVGCYVSVKSEFHTKPIIETIWKAKKVCYLPILVDTKSLSFIRYNEGDELQPNQFAIPEPVMTYHTINPERLDLVIAPMVAFDRAGRRLGTGGGYYDRTFAFMFNKKEKVPFMLGLGYSAQECSEIEEEPWDISLDGVLTEKEIITF